MIKFPCPGCQTIFTVTDEKAGKKGKCPKCQSPFTIPQPEAAAASPPPAPKPDPNAPVEISPCPGCQAVLTVAAEFLGADVECPNCNTVFTATKPGAKPKPKPVPPPPPPPPPPPANAFANFDEPAEEEEEPRPKKGKSKAKVDLDDEEDEAPRKKSKRPIEDDEPMDDEDDYERDGPTKGKAKKGKNGLLLAAGIIHIVMALIFAGCGGGMNFCGSAVLGAALSSPQIEKNNQMANDPYLKNDKVFQEALKKQNDAVSAVKNYALVTTIDGAGFVLASILGIVAGIGCLMRKPFGKLLTFGAGPLDFMFALLGALAPMLILPAEVPKGPTLAMFGGMAFLALLYAGGTIFMVLKGFKKEAGGSSYSKKKPSRDDEDEPEPEEEEIAPPKKGKSKAKIDLDDEEDDLPPPPKKGKKKIVEEDEEDDLPPPPKKKSGGNDFAFDDDEDEAPKPKKKKPRRDDDD